MSTGKKDEDEAPRSVAADDSTSLPIPPEILEKLPQMMSALSGISGISEKSTDFSSGKNTQRAALLKALKPYLSERRRSVIDGMIGMEGIARVLGTLKDT